MIENGGARTGGTRLRPWGRMLAYAVVAAAGVTCDSPTALGRPGVVAVAPSLAPVFSQLQFSGLVVDQARITVTRPPAEVVATQTFAFPPGASQINAAVDVLVQGGGESFDVRIELLAAGAVVFTGSQQVFVVPGPPSSTTPPVQIPVAYNGPGTNVAALSISPANATVSFGQTLQFDVAAVDSQQQSVASFYAGWRSTDPAHVISATGVLRAGNQRGAFYVVAETPTGIADSVRVFAAPTASAVAAVSGGGQTGPVGTRLAQPVVARVTAADGGPVGGVTVVFDVASGGGAVDSASVVTDSAGLAGTTVVLGPTPGSNLFRATVGSLPRVTFTATATPPAGVPASIQKTAGDVQAGTAGTPVAIAPQVRVLDALGTRVAGVQVQFAVTGGGGSVTGGTVTTDTGGYAQVGSWTLGAAGANALAATLPAFPAVPAAVFTATASPAAPAIQLSVPGGAVGLSGPTLLTVKLPTPAPAGGVTVTVVSDSTQYVTVQPPGTVAFAQGDTLGVIDLVGVSAGVASIRASAPGYAPDTLFVVVTPNVLVVASAGVSVGQSTTVTITAIPSPAGALSVTVTSTDTTIARVTTPVVTINAGQSQTTATVQGVAAGSVGILATATGYAQGAGLFTVTAGGVADTVIKTAGDGLTAFINDTTAVRPTVTVLDALGAPVQGVQVLFSVGAGGGTIGGTAAVSANTNASGVAVPAGTWRMGGAAGTNTLVASLPAHPAVTPQTFTATAVLPPPVIQMSVFGSNVVGQGRSGQLVVRLLQPAPTGLIVTLTTTQTGLLYVGSYGSESGTVPFTTGDTVAFTALHGDSSAVGVDTIIATATGYTPDTLAVPVSLNLISLPPTLNVPLSQNVSLPINLSVAAPAGGLKVAVTSADPAILQVVTDTVMIAQGSQVGNATVFGAALGSVTVNATNPNYAPDVTTVNVTASLNITQATVAPNASFGLPITIQLESGGTPISAPAGGIPVTLTPRNPACAAAPNTTIPAGLVSVSVTVTYGGSATLPCSTYLVASGPAGFTTDSVLVNMQVQPSATVSATFLGSGLQRQVNASLGASNHGGTTVRLESLQPSKLLVAPNDTTPGSAFIDVPINVGVTSIAYALQALDGIVNDSAFVTVSAPGFVPDTAKISIYQGVFDIIFLNGSGNTRSANDAFQVRTGSASSPTGGISVEDALRTGGPARTFSIVNDSVLVGDLVTTALTGDSVTVQIAPRQARSPGTAATGGVEFDYTAGGVTNVRASEIAAFFRPVGAALGQTVTVTAPTVNLGSTFIGARLQRQMSASLSAAAVAGDTVTLAVAQPGILRISPDDSTGFADTIRIGLAAGATSFSYWIQGVDSIVADTVGVTATMPAYTGMTASYRVYTPVFDLIFLNATGNTRSVNDPFQARLGSASSPTGGISVEDVLRFGHAPMTFSVVNDSVAVGELVTTALTGDSVTVQVAARQSRSPSTVATGGVEFDYVTGGVTNVRAAEIAGLARPVGAALGQSVTVSAPTITLGSTYIGARLQRQTSGSLSAAAVAGDTVTLTVDQPGILRISPNDSTGFADTIRIALNAGATSFNYWIQGVDTIVADTVNVIATMPTYTPDTAAYRVYTPVYDIIFLASSANTLANNDPFQVRLGSASTPTGGISVEDVLRFAHPPLDATIRSLQPTVAQLVTQTATGDSVTVQVAPRQSRSPSTVATGGVELDYLTTGSTVIIADIPQFRALASDTQAVTVTAPVATLSALTVGAGLQVSTSGNLSSGNHGGISVVVKSANPAVALVSPNATTPGTDSIVIAVAPGGTGFSFYVQGVEGATGGVTLRATAPGFTDGTATATIVQPSVDIIFLSASGSAASTADDPFQARIGYANAPTYTGMSSEQEIRAGAPGPLTVTITTTNPAAGLLNTSAQTGQSQVTLTIPIGQSRTPSTLATGGVTFDFVAQGVTFVVPTITGFVTVQQSAPPQPGFRVTVSP